MAEPIRLPHHQLGLEFRTDPLKGRGVFATQAIPRRTLIDISPVLVFPADEYDLHGQHTQLDHYTYKWQHGSMALALGLGSMFNHANEPNVGFFRDFGNSMIKYVALRDLAVDEELCISYGANLWFEDAAAAEQNGVNEGEVEEEEEEDAWLQFMMMDTV
ncbi:hypothetical protein [Absidia glauca]|uniref:SET domain-containing protein n=1 Tax=Absidia glauca TaxID=4829 RepID=A0A163JXV9_ABSGL|nr:hypothetical protein [Absidia glauca]